VSAPSTIGNLDRTLATAATDLTAALKRGDLAEASNINALIEALLDHRLAQMALRTP